MNVDELRAGLDFDDPGPRRDVVLAGVVTRRRRRRRRQLVAGGCAAVLVAAAGVGASVWQPWATNGGKAPVAPLAEPPMAGGCGKLSLQQQLSTARSDGGSVIEAYGHLTTVGRTDGGTPYRQFALTGVRTLAGSVLPATTSGWLASAPQAAGAAGGGGPGVWAPDGHLVAIVEPASVTGTAVGPVLRVAPVVGSTVVLSTAGCWPSAGLATTPYTGPLAEVPGTGAIAAAATAGGFHAYPLSQFAALAAH